MTHTTAEAMEKIIRIPDETGSVGTDYQGTDIEEVILPEGLRIIEDGAFRDCANLKKINFPSTLEHIGRDAFNGCTALKIPPIPSSTRYIGERAFHACTSIDRFEIDGNNLTFKVYKNALYGTDHSLIAYPAGSRESKYEVHEDTRTIRDYAFCGNTNIKGIRLGANVSEVTGKAFLGCRRLKIIEVDPKNEELSSGNGLYSDYGRSLVYIPPAPRINNLRMLNVEVMGPSCLADCDKIDVLYLGDCLEDLASDAFGDKCRPKKIIIDKNFACDPPFGITLPEEEPSPDIGGYIYRRNKNGEYELIGTTSAERERFEFYDNHEFIMYGGDEEEEQSRFRSVKVEDTKLSDIAGLEEAKEAIYQHLILPAMHPDLFDRFGMDTATGVLLYGPPGTGKTMLARAVAHETDARFYSIKSSDIRDCYVGKSEENIRDLFETARRDERAVIFFDDFDSIGRSRGNSHEPWQSDLIDELLVQMQGVEKQHGNILILAATNRPWDIDSALMRSGRFSIHIHVGLPNTDAREIIIRNNLRNVPLAGNLDCRWIASRTEGYNGADVEELCKAAKMRRISLIVAGDNADEMTAADFDYALSRIHSSVSKKDLKDIETYRRGGTPDSGDAYVPAGGMIPGYQ